jgi:hypothetical protein
MGRWLMGDYGWSPWKSDGGRTFDGFALLWGLGVKYVVLNNYGSVTGYWAAYGDVTPVGTVPGSKYYIELGPIVNPANELPDRWDYNVLAMVPVDYVGSYANEYFYNDINTISLRKDPGGGFIRVRKGSTVQFDDYNLARGDGSFDRDTDTFGWLLDLENNKLYICHIIPPYTSDPAQVYWLDGRRPELNNGITLPAGMIGKEIIPAWSSYNGSSYGYGAAQMNASRVSAGGVSPFFSQAVDPSWKTWANPLSPVSKINEQSWNDALVLIRNEQLFKDALVIGLFEQLFDDAPVVNGILEAPYDDAAVAQALCSQPFGIKIVNEVIQKYGIKVGTELLQAFAIKTGSHNVQKYGDKPVLLKSNKQLYADAKTPRKRSVQRYDNTLSSKRVNKQIYTLMYAPKVVSVQPYTITQFTATEASDQSYDVLDINKATKTLDQRYNLLQDEPNVQDLDSLNISAYVEETGDSVILNGLDIKADLGSYSLSLGAEIADADSYALINPGDTFNVTIGGQEFRFLIEGKNRSRSFGNSTFNIDGISPTAKLDVPYTEPISKTWDTITNAKDIVLELLDGKFALDWQVVDWALPANLFIANNETPLALIKKLAAAVGGMVQTSPDGNTLSVIYRYKVSPPTEGTPDLILTDFDHFFTTNESYEHRSGYNKVQVTNQGITSADAVNLGQIRIDNHTYEIRGSQVPFVGAFDLKHSGGSWVSIENQGVNTLVIVREQVEIVAGKGSVANPMYAIDLDRTKYEYADLGAISWQEDGTIETEIKGMSLMYVTYTTKYKKWIARDPNIEDVQFYVESSE